MKNILLNRFLKYASIDTQSDPDSDSFPSTAKQISFLRMLAEELRGAGLSEVSMDEYGYVMATVPATEGCGHEPVIGFLAHVDTSPEMCGSGVRPQVIASYDGRSDIGLGAQYRLSPEEFPDLRSMAGHTLVTTDGRTLLGADDKCGVAEIVTACEYLLEHPEIRHGKIRIAFTPDEEIGRGTDRFEVTAFGADFAYTVDGGGEGELEYECFNAAGVTVTIRGRNIHPGSAKGVMVNAARIAGELDRAIPSSERPETTEGYEGFFHLDHICGDVENVTMRYIIRDHDRVQFEEKKRRVSDIAVRLNDLYGQGTVTVETRDQYYNMKEIIGQHPDIIRRASRAMQLAGVEPVIKPIRGGTDGARLSFEGLPCPNIFTGGMNFHGRYEYCSVEVMVKAVMTIVNIADIRSKDPGPGPGPAGL